MKKLFSTALLALVAMTGWAQTAKKSAPESFKGTAVKDSASIYHTLPLPLPSKGEGLSAEGMFVPDVQMEANVSVWKAYFDTLKNHYRKIQTLTKTKGNAESEQIARKIYQHCQQHPAWDDVDKEKVIKELKQLKRRTKNRHVRQLFDKSIGLIQG